MPEKRRNYEKLGDFEMPEEMAAKVEAMIAQADEEDELARVNFRWSKEALEVVRQAAKLMGIPYQTFIKQTVFEHALSILKDMGSSQESDIKRRA
jgi:predicted DNA binding CopG/RHH family protein